MNIANAYKHISFIYDGYPHTKNGGGELRFKNKGGKIAIRRFFQTPAEMKVFIKSEDNKYLLNNSHVYISTNLRDRPKGDEDAIDTCNMLYADLDSKDAITYWSSIVTLLTQKNFRPSFVTMTGNGIHLWWKLAIPVTKDDLKIYLRALNKMLQKEFEQYNPDTSVISPAWLLRLAGTYNVKKEPIEVKILDEYYGEYTPDNVEIILGNYIDKTKKIKQHVEPATWKQRIPEHIETLVKMGVDSSGELSGWKVKGRSKNRFLIMFDLYKRGYSWSEIGEKVIEFNRNCTNPEKSEVVNDHIEQIRKNIHKYAVVVENE